MFAIWANLTLLVGALIVAGVLWFVLTVIGKGIFEDLIGGSIKKMRRKMKHERDKDHYVY
jgi:hypothetical protein